MKTQEEKISRDQMRKITHAVDAALEAVAKKFKIEIEKTTASWSPTSGSFTIKFNGHTADGLSSEAAAYKRIAKLHGLPALGTSFKFQKKTLTVIGWRSRSREWPILCAVSGTAGKKMAITVDDLKKYSSV